MRSIIASPPVTGVLANDVHSRLNQTRVARVLPVDTPDAVCAAVHEARATGVPVSVAGGRHAMGGQQFATGASLLDSRAMRRVLSFDPERGLVEVEAGIQWPELVAFLVPTGWTIAQKQTGADDFTVGGSIAANCHGRGLTLAPIVADVEALRVVRPDGSQVTCSRTEHAELFALVVGGYGLFGVITSAVLRLVRRAKLERVVTLATADELPDAFAARIDEGYRYGDFQFAVDPASPDFLHRGVFSCYRPVDSARPIPAGQQLLSRADWQRLLLLAHVDKDRAFREYAGHYLATSGQLYWSDEQQLGRYVDGYHERIDEQLGRAASEMIGEVYVPRDRLAGFLAAAAAELRRHRADVIYGTVRLIRRDVDTVLAWARQDWACVVVNLHVRHDPVAVARAAVAFRALIDLAAERGGTYYLTYSRWATPEQLRHCHPRIDEVLRRKRGLDPDELLTSEWYRALTRSLAH